MRDSLGGPLVYWRYILVPILGPLLPLTVVRLFSLVRPLGAFAIAIAGQAVLSAAYPTWEHWRIKRLIDAPSTHMTLIYTQDDTSQQDDTSHAKLSRFIGHIWSLPGLLLVACAVAVVFLGLEYLFVHILATRSGAA
jgi:hypothetical protein